MSVTEFLQRTRHSTWPAITVVIVGFAGFALVSNWLLSQGPVRQALDDLQTTTGGVIGPTFVAGMAALVLVVLLVLGLAQLRPADVGWHPRLIGPALAIIGAMWVATQGILVVVVTFAGGSLAWHADWRQPGLVAGILLGQVLGTALVEETVYRGFLLPQLFHKASERYRPMVALAVATLASQLLFALSHLPYHVFMWKHEAQELILVQLVSLAIGLVFAAVFLTTRNLFLSVGVHAIGNAPTPLVQIADDHARVAWFALVLLLLIAWMLARKSSARKSRLKESDSPRPAP